MAYRVVALYNDAARPVILYAADQSVAPADVVLADVAKGVREIPCFDVGCCPFRAFKKTPAQVRNVYGILLLRHFRFDTTGMYGNEALIFTGRACIPLDYADFKTLAAAYNTLIGKPRGDAGAH